MKKIVPDPPLTLEIPALGTTLELLEIQLAEASDLLRCAGATVYECADSLSGQPRHLAMASMRLISQAQEVVDRLLDQLQPQAVATCPNN